jgi:hypothetical protein
VLAVVQHDHDIEIARTRERRELGNRTGGKRFEDLKIVLAQRHNRIAPRVCGHAMIAC